MSSPCVGGTSVPVAPCARNNGVVFDSTLSMVQQVSSICRSSYFHSKNIRALRKVLTRSETDKLVHAFITPRLDLNNALLYGVPQSTLATLQRIQNMPAGLITGARKHDRINPILQYLHWLPISHRNHYKILLFVYEALHEQAPAYISNMAVLYQPRRTLRSSGDNFLRTPATRSKDGDRAFSCGAPSLWNKLTADIKHSPTVASFKSKLKSFFIS